MSNDCIITGPTRGNIDSPNTKRREFSFFTENGRLEFFEKGEGLAFAMSLTPAQRIQLACEILEGVPALYLMDHPNSMFGRLVNVVDVLKKAQEMRTK